MDLKVKFSGQALAMLKHFPNVDKEKIAQWYIDNKLIIGGLHILEYLELPNKEEEK